MQILAKPSVFPPAILEFPFCSRIRILDILELYVHVLLACICAREPMMSGFINDLQLSAETLSREWRGLKGNKRLEARARWYENLLVTVITIRPLGSIICLIGLPRILHCLLRTVHATHVSYKRSYIDVDIDVLVDVHRVTFLLYFRRSSCFRIKAG